MAYIYYIPHFIYILQPWCQYLQIYIIVADVATDCCDIFYDDFQNCLHRTLLTNIIKNRIYFYNSGWANSQSGSLDQYSE